MEWGFLEGVSQLALGQEFSLQWIPNKAQLFIDIRYQEVLLEKKYLPDFICYDKVIVEIKAISTL